MSYDELENAWRSPRNMPATGALTAARERLFAELARRRLGKRVFLAVVLGALTVITTRVAFAVCSRGGTPVMNLEDDWAAWLFLAIPWVGFFLLLHRSVRSERVNPASVRSVGEAVRALLDENTAARHRLAASRRRHSRCPLVARQIAASTTPAPTGGAGPRIRTFGLKSGATECMGRSKGRGETCNFGRRACHRGFKVRPAPIK